MSNRTHPTEAIHPIAAVIGALERLANDAIARGDSTGAEAWRDARDHALDLEVVVRKARMKQHWGKAGEVAIVMPPRGVVLE